jgi:hypothetical protein
MKVQRKPSGELDAIRPTNANALLEWVRKRGGEFIWIEHRVNEPRWFALFRLDNVQYGPIAHDEVVVIETVGTQRRLLHMQPEEFAEMFDVVRVGA